MKRDDLEILLHNAAHEIPNQKRAYRRLSTELEGCLEANIRLVADADVRNDLFRTQLPRSMAEAVESIAEDLGLPAETAHKLDMTDEGTACAVLARLLDPETGTSAVIAEVDELLRGKEA